MSDNITTILEECCQCYSEILRLDSADRALDLDSLKTLNILAAVSRTAALDLYDVIDFFEEEHMLSRDSFHTRLMMLLQVKLP